MKEILDDVVVALFTYNQDKYTRESILSIFNQTVWPRKLMIFDDGSSDYTEEVIKDALKDKPIGLDVEVEISLKNSGLATQINKLRGKFSQTLIITQHCDDIAVPTRIEEQYRLWKSEQKPTLILSQFDCIDEDSNVVSRRDTSEKFNFDVDTLIKRKIMPSGCSMAIDSSLFNDFPPIDAKVINEDRIFLFRSLLKGKAIKIMSSLILYRHEVGNSTLKMETKSTFISSWRTILLRESYDLPMIIKDCGHIGAHEYIPKLITRQKYIALLLNLFNAKYDTKMEAWLAFFSAKLPYRLVSGYRHKVRGYFKSIK
ncbi:Glyco_trans_2-like domain-containing protein [Vibrio chagasii]|uniref:glycosyltransferase n=1 Tax=Vibrio chagasii TaxID=170679 RepID=UPI003381EC0E|nr:Glyco_trans_2-like domain-containing protein [Vibrio chagasii]CAH7484891.1 Glyco_trans_2-like domain-containing protein [Vibrio chagasii]